MSYFSEHMYRAKQKGSQDRVHRRVESGRLSFTFSIRVSIMVLFGTSRMGADALQGDKP